MGPETGSGFSVMRARPERAYNPRQDPRCPRVLHSPGSRCGQVAMESAPEDIELELRRLEETHEESERRLKQLTESRLPTEREIEAALTLSKSLPMLDIEIRRLRAELAKARAARAAGEEKSPDPSSST